MERRLPYCPIGTPVWNIKTIVIDSELIVANIDTSEYLEDKISTSKQFCELGWRSMDRVEQVEILGEQMLCCIGRLDSCVKIRGFKVDLLAVEDCIRSIKSVKNVAACHDADENKLIVFVVWKDGQTLDLRKTKAMDRLPKSHHPQLVIPLSDFPLTRTGKVEKMTLMRQYKERSFIDKATTNLELKAKVVNAWQSIFPSWVGKFEEDWELNFWDQGGHSLGAIKLCAALGIPAKFLLSGKVSSPKSIYNWLCTLSGTEAMPASLLRTKMKDQGGGVRSSRKVAVIGYAGRWPGIGQTTIEDIFKNLATKTPFEPLSDPPKARNIGNVKKGFYLHQELVRGFDCHMWNARVDEVVLWDPHLRVFLEMCYEALSDAGLQPHLYQSSPPRHCGVFASSGSLSHYLDGLSQNQSLANIRVRDPGRYFQLEVGCDKDYLATMASHFFNFTGPSQVIQTACSSVLVGVAEAVDSIRAGRCSLALAGGVSMQLPQEEHAHREGLIWSADGRCRPFDVAASGTANCNGGGVFVLKDLEQARKDGDPIYGCISGVAVRNDGRKRDFTAPSIDGHAQTIRQALDDAKTSPSDVCMVEAHGTGTYVGDPIEVDALCEGYSGKREKPISLGSVKGNIGHANTAAGAMGMAKVLMCLSHRILVPSGNFHKLNPLIHSKLVRQPLLAVQESIENWLPIFGKTKKPRAAGISALGIGGTNAHLILEEDTESRYKSTKEEQVVDPIFCISANSFLAAKKYATRLYSYLQDISSSSPTFSQDVAYTLFNHRDLELPFRVCAQMEDLVKFEPLKRTTSSPVVTLLFPGQGSGPLPPVGFKLHPDIINCLGRCPLAHFFATENAVDKQVALFSLQYSIALEALEALRLNNGNAIEVVLCGHSLGEWVAATVSGAIDLAFALECVRKRGEMLVKHTSEGAMASVSATLVEVEEKLKSFSGVEVACINRSDRITVSGFRDAVKAFAQKSGLPATILDVAGAFHSQLAEPAGDELFNFMETKVVTQNEKMLLSPKLRWLSSSTADFVTYAPSSSFWKAQTVGKVYFASCMDKLVATYPKNNIIFVDVGPGSVASSFVKQIEAPCVRIASKGTLDKRFSCKLWALGVDNIDLDVPKVGHRVLALPPYTWDRIDCWYDESGPKSAAIAACKQSNQMHFFYKTTWEKRTLDADYENPEVGVLPFYTFGRSLDISFCLPTTFTVECIALDDVTLQRSVAKFRKLIVFQGLNDSVGESDVPTSQIDYVAEILETIQALVEAKLSLELCLFVVKASHLLSGSVGALRCANNEHPELNIKICLLELPCNLEPLLASPLLSSSVEVQLTKESEVKVRNLVPVYDMPQKGGRESIHVNVTGTYIVTGGHGGLGKLVVKWLKNKGVTRIIIVSRRPLEEAPSFSCTGCDVRFISCDISSFDDFRAGLASESIPPSEINGIFHCAGVVFDCLIQKAPTNRAVLTTYMGAKVCGIDTLLRGTPNTTFLVLFSSSSAVLGSPGQAVYCAANAVLDACADMHCETLPVQEVSKRQVVSLQWGGWSSSVEGSMADRFELEPVDGERFLSKEAGIWAMEVAMRSGLPAVMIANIFSWLRYASAVSLQKRSLVGLLPFPDDHNGWIPNKYQLHHSAKHSRYSWILDHCVDGVPILPATFLLEAFSNGISDNCVSLSDVNFINVAHIGTWLRVETSKCGRRTLVWSTPFEETHDETTNYPPVCHAIANLDKEEGITHCTKVLLHLYQAQTISWRSLNVETMYKFFCTKGFKYGPAFALTRTLFVSDSLAVGAIEDNTDKLSCNFATTLDACAHAAVWALRPRIAGGIPVSVDLFRVFMMTASECISLQLPGGTECDGWMFIARVSSKDVGQYDRNHGVFDLFALRKSDGTALVMEGLVIRTPQIDNGSSNIKLFRGNFEPFDPFEVENRRPTSVRLGLRTKANEVSVVNNVKEWLAIRRRQPNVNVVCSQGCDGKIGNIDQSSWFVAGRGALVFQAIDSHTSSVPLRNVSDVPKIPFVVHMSSNSVNFEPWSPEHVVKLSRPGPNEVAVQVSTWGLNFLDVLAVSGVMPSEHFGSECVGVVTAIGSKVSRIAVGDRIAAVCSGGFGSHVILPVQFVHAVPTRLNDCEAATIPVAYLTAWLALHRHARVSQEDSVLVHNASGGVGLACINLLKELGCDKVWATCSQTTKKLKVLHEHGVERTKIYDSKDVACWEAGCNDIDVVVGALFGQSLRASMAITNRLGRVVDLGKREQMEGGKLDLSPFLRGVTYTSAHLDALMEDSEGSTIRQLTASVWKNLGKGVKPLPFVEYDLQHISDAIQYLSSGKHTGKVVVTMPKTAYTTSGSEESESEILLSMDQENEYTQMIAQAINKLDPPFPSVCIASLSVSNPFAGPASTSDIREQAAATIASSCLLDHGEKCRLIEIDGAIFRRWNDSDERKALFYDQLEGILKAAVTNRHVVALAHRTNGAPIAVHNEWTSLLLHSHVTSSGPRDTERNWLISEVKRLLRTSTTKDLEENTLEELGFDSLARLQLYHTLKTEFPSSSISDLAGDLKLCQIFRDTADLKGSVKASHRWLVLHGFRTNAACVSQQVGQLRSIAFKDCDFIYIQAPIPYQGNSGAIPSNVGPLFEWWSCDDPADTHSYERGWIGSKGLSESLIYLTTEVENLGGGSSFDGVIGFSQGATMAWHLAAEGIISKAILFSPVDPVLPKNYEALKKKGLRKSSSIPLPSGTTVALVYDPLDSPSKNFVENFGRTHSLAELPTRSQVRILTHSAGHNIPSDNIDKMKNMYEGIRECIAR